jgi:ABC-2 type transport system permease protein
VTAAATGGTALRVLTQLRRDPRTVALMLLVPAILVTLIRYVFDAQPETFDRLGAPLIGLFPFNHDVPGHLHHDAARADQRHP